MGCKIWGGGGSFEGTFQRAIGLFLCQFMVFERGLEVLWCYKGSLLGGPFDLVSLLSIP